MRLTRVRVLVGLVLLSVGLSASGQPVLAQPVPQEIRVNFLSLGEPDTLDPNRTGLALASDAASVIRQVFEPLLRFDASLIPQPAAAESYDVSADGTVYTFHLRQDGYWSDGLPVTAAQFEYSWNRLLDPSTHAAYAALFGDAGILSVRALDDFTLEIRLKQPFGALPDLAALWVGVPLRQDVVEADPDGWAQDPSTFIGNGPFMMSDWVHQDHITLVPNPAYAAHFNWPKPTLTRVTLLMGTNADADFAAYKNGERDWTLVPDADVNAALNDPDLTRQAHRFNELSTFWVQINNGVAPLNDVNVRRALAMGIDRRVLVRDLTSGIGVPATSILPPGMPGFAAGLGSDLAFDPQAARALLTQAGFPDSLDFSQVAFSYPDTADARRRAESVRAQWRLNLGVDIALDPVDARAYPAVVDATDYDLAFGGWAGDYPDPRDWLDPVFGCRGAYNTLNYCDSSFDQVVARADAGASLTDRLQAVSQAQRLLLQDVPVIPLFVRGRLALVQPWVRSTDGGALPITAGDDYPGSLFLDKVQILPH